MDSRIIMLVMSLMTFVAYPFLSGSDRKQVSLLASPATQTDELEDDEDPVMMQDEDNEVADLQLDTENQYIKSKASDAQIREENQQIKNSASDPQLAKEDDVEEDY